jgi:DNA-directed RNA polymerase specialized sigma24 family protein
MRILRSTVSRTGKCRQRVDAELRKVAEPYRTTLILRDLEDMSYEEIAEVLEISLGTVKSQLDARVGRRCGNG